MATSFEYLVVRRTTRATSWHETEELQTRLNEYAAQGWRLRQVIDQTAQHQVIIFERGKDEEQDRTAGISD